MGGRQLRIQGVVVACAQKSLVLVAEEKSSHVCRNSDGNVVANNAWVNVSSLLKTKLITDVMASLSFISYYQYDSCLCLFSGGKFVM